MEAVDRTSSLPHDLTHHIMSLLPMKDIARTSILSKRWMSLWLCFPVQVFDERWFKGRRESCRRDFHEYLRRSLARRDFDNIRELKIITYSDTDHELKHLITRFVAKAMLLGKLQKLDLHVRDHVGNNLCDHYGLPRAIFSSGSFLVSLTIQYCKIGAYQKVSLPLLQNMKLILVHVTNCPLERVIRNCPNLETLTLEYCHGFDTLKLFNPSVRRLIVRGCTALQGFEMDAPSLNYFHCRGTRDFDESFVYRPEDFCCRFLEFKVANENSVSSLETAVFSFMVLNDRTLESALSKFSNLQTLKLLSSTFGKLPSSLSSALLKKLKLVRMENCRFDGPVEINSPNLETFVYKAGHGEIASFHFGGRGFGNIKTLSVNGFLGLRHKSLEELISSCILLENLYLNSCAIPEGHLEIYSSTLKTLAVHGCDHLQFAEIQAPQLVYFQYVGQLENFPTLNFAPCDLDADLHLVSKPSRDIHYAQLINLKNRFRNVDQTRILTIISNSAEFVIFQEKVAESFLNQPVSKLKTSFVEILSRIFRASFCHETLWINLGDTVIELKFKTSKLEVSSPELMTDEDGIPHPVDVVKFEDSNGNRDHHDCIQHHLTMVRLESFDGSANQMELLTHLLQKAQFLELMSISFNDRENHTLALTDSSEVINKLINYPRASQVAQIISNRCFLHSD